MNGYGVRRAFIHQARTLGFVLAVVTFCLAPQAGAGADSSAQPTVAVASFKDTVQPVSQGYLDRALDSAAAMHASALLVELDTPGGLLDTTRAIVHSILASPIPVIVYVAPAGARAGSAGFFLLESADVAAMAPGTNAGAAHPVVEGAKLDPVMKQKIKNDATAFLRSYATARGRNAEAASQAVLESKSYTEQEALNLHLIDLVATSESALLNQLNGREITRFDGSKTRLNTRDARLVPIRLTVREQVLDRLVDPNLALLAFAAGALLIYLEFNIPGTIIPGALGTLLLLLSLFALNLLPIRYTAVLLLAGALVLLVLEAKFASHGVLAAAGVVSLVAGSLTLVAAPVPEMRVRPATAISTGLAFGVITVVLVRIALRARRNKSLMGAGAMVGALGRVQVSLTPAGLLYAGQVFVRGELWEARAAEPIPAGAPVRVLAVEGLTLVVERAPAALAR